MIRSLLLAILVAATSCAAEPSRQNETDARVIPLEEVWAYGMPGTRVLTDALNDEGYISEEGPLLRDIRRYLTGGHRPEVAPTGFAISGSGIGALEEVHRIFASNEDSDELEQPSLCTGQSISLVFFSYSLGSNVHIESVSRNDNAFQIKCRFVSHESTNATQHIALIPVGELQAGEYSVDIEVIPSSKEAANRDRVTAKRFVCRSFTFTVDGTD